MKKLAKLALAGLAVISAHSGVEAAVVLVTYTGSVSSGTDHTNFFGTGNTNLTGQAFTLQFTLDSATPGALTECDPGRFCSIYGEFAANPLTTRFTLNGVSRDWGDSTFYNEGGAFQFNDEGRARNNDEVSHFSTDKDDPDEEDIVNISIRSTVNVIVGSMDFTDPLDYFVQSGDQTSGRFATFDQDPVTGVFSRRASANLLPTRVTIAPLDAAIPEPSTWAMLIVGFGLIGGTLRMRRRRALSLAAV